MWLRKTVKTAKLDDMIRYDIKKPGAASVYPMKPEELL